MDEMSYLQLHLTKGIGPATFQKLLAHLKNSEASIGDLKILSVNTLMKELGLARSQAEAFNAAHKTAESTYAVLQKRALQLIPLDSPTYPIQLQRQLGSHAPPLLYAWGNLELLQRKSVGFCGARDASEKGLAVAEDCAAQIAKWKWVSISGGARGVDTTVHRAALQNHGSTIIVLPEGILQYQPRAELKSLFKAEHTLIISEFPPYVPWSVGAAMQRNRTVCGLANAMIVIESGTSGGTFEAGQQALRLNIPLFVADYSDPPMSAAGNAYFLSMGAYPLRRSVETGLANLTALQQAIATLLPTPSTSTQERLL